MKRNKRDETLVESMQMRDGVTNEEEGKNGV